MNAGKQLTPEEKNRAHVELMKALIRKIENERKEVKSADGKQAEADRQRSGGSSSEPGT